MPPRSWRAAVADRFDVELINNNNYFVFQPLLPEVAAATIHSSDAVAPLRLLLRGTQIRQADVMGIDFAKKTVTVVQGFRRVPVDLPYDELDHRARHERRSQPLPRPARARAHHEEPLRRAPARARM